jgi:predicted dehydrogenase
VNTLRIGLIGCGPRGCTLVNTCRPIRDVRINALCDNFPARIDEVASFMLVGQTHGPHRRAGAMPGGVV